MKRKKIITIATLSISIIFVPIYFLTGIPIIGFVGYIAMLFGGILLILRV